MGENHGNLLALSFFNLMSRLIGYWGEVIVFQYCSSIEGVGSKTQNFHAIFKGGKRTRRGSRPIGLPIYRNKLE